MASGRKVTLIESSDEESGDNKKTSNEPAANTKNCNQKVADSKKPKSISFNGLNAQLLLTFFEKELERTKIEVSTSKLNGKELVELSSSNHTLLATHKQRLQKLLNSTYSQEIDVTSQQLQVDELIKSNGLNVLVCDLQSDKLKVYYTEKSEFEKLQKLLKPKISTRRKERKFADPGSSATARSSEQSETKDTENYDGPSSWQSSTPSDMPSSNIKNSSSCTFLGENIQVKLILDHNGITTKIYEGSITRAKVVAIVNAANERLDNCGGVAEVISKAAGEQMERECRDKMKGWERIKVSENIVTCAGKLPCSWIIHAVGPRWSNYVDKEKALEDLYKTVVNILNTAREREMKSVVMPPISSGIFGVPKQACAAMYLRALFDFSEKHPRSTLREFHIIDMKSDVLDLICTEYQESFKHGRERLTPSNVIERLGIRTRGTTWTHRNVCGMSSANGIQENSANAKQKLKHFSKQRLRENGHGKFTVDDKLEVHIYTNNILNLQNVSILVCAEGLETQISGRIAKTIFEQAKKNQKEKIKALLSGNKYYSQIKQINFGIFGYQMLFFAIMKRFGENAPRHEDLMLLKNTTVNILEAANKKKKNNKSELSLAMPLLGTGSTSSKEYLHEYAKVVCDCIMDFAKEIKENARLKTVHLVNFNESQTNALYKAFKNRCVSSRQGSEAWSPSGMKDFNKGSTRPQFDASKYKKQEVWETVINSESDFESFIERVKEDEKKKEGNIVFIDSDEEEDISSHVENAEPSMCIICMDGEMEDPVKLKNCQHKFCRNCIEECFSRKPVCPVCSTVYGEIFGNQPPGTATVYLDSNSLPGYDCSTIIIHYEIPDGMQTNEHPNPDVPFTGLSRQGYLPDNSEGRSVLGLLKKAFEHRLIFTVGVSRSSGKDNVVTWNDIHHKTRRDGGPEKFGYPDEEYLERVKEELAAKGISND
uniref:E3 ubiquitin-protein ligase n=1 Tax=Crassostrea virginica TaxID=6565 RepID=A0A8B8EQT7_CRAVI|nr:uncharacterized protein LOC111136032 [Crassostrea virginica]